MLPTIVRENIYLDMIGIDVYSFAIAVIVFFSVKLMYEWMK